MTKDDYTLMQQRHNQEKKDLKKIINDLTWRLTKMSEQVKRLSGDLRKLKEDK